MARFSTTIEINDVDIKLFQAQRARRKDTFMVCDVRPVSGCTHENIVELLEDMVGSLPIIPEEPILLLPRCFAILRQLRLPSHEHNEIEDMIGLQLVNNIPYAVEDVIYRHHLLGQDSDGYSRVLVIIMRREVIERYQQVLRKVGIKGGILTLSSFGILDWLVYQEGVCKIANNQAVAFLNIDSQYSEVCFCYDKKLFFSRNISSYGKQLTLSDTEELADQMGLSLSIYHEERLGPEVGKILIPSSCTEALVLKNKLENKLGLPVEITCPLENVFYSSRVDKVISQKHYPFSITAGLGLLLTKRKDLINLASEEIHAEKQIRTQRLQLAKFILLSFIVAILSVSSWFIDIHKKGTRLELLRSEIVRLQPQLKDAGQKTKFVKFFDKKLAQHSFIPDLLEELNHLTPKDISFSTLSLDREKRLIIHGYVQEYTGINDFQTRLIQSSRFYDVDLKFATKRKIANRTVMDFKIALQLSPDTEASQ